MPSFKSKRVFNKTGHKLVKTNVKEEFSSWPATQCHFAKLSPSKAVPRVGRGVPNNRSDTFSIHAAGLRVKEAHRVTVVMEAIY